MSKSIHRKLNVEYLISNKYIHIKSTKILKKFHKALNSKEKPYVFVGEQDPETQLPDGLVRCVNHYGNIYEGYFTTASSNLKMNGFCISYLGKMN